MKQLLQDVVAHTKSIGILLVKVTNTEDKTTIFGKTVDNTVVMTAVPKEPITSFTGVFGMPNLTKLDIILKCPIYTDESTIDVIRETRNGVDVPTELHFKNESGDFENHYRFMDTELANELISEVYFKGANYVIQFTPALASIQKLKYQSLAHSEEPNVQIRTEGNNLVFSFGDDSTHAGSFVFQSDVENTLKHTWTWPIANLQTLLNLTGDIFMKVSDQGAMEIVVDSGTVVYSYLLPALTK